MISAIVPVGNYIRDKDNIYNIIKSTINKDIELIIVNDSENLISKTTLMVLSDPTSIVLDSTPIPEKETLVPFFA